MLLNELPSTTCLSDVFHNNTGTRNNLAWVSLTVDFALTSQLSKSFVALNLQKEKKGCEMSLVHVQVHTKTYIHTNVRTRENL